MKGMNKYNMKLNKKGFTLVELLAVIVVLALLMVVLANTALPAMNNAKKKTFLLYAQRLMERGQELYFVDKNSTDGNQDYTVEQLMGASAKANYDGTINVDYDAPNEKFTVTVKGQLKDVKNNLCIASGKEIKTDSGVDIITTCT